MLLKLLSAGVRLILVIQAAGRYVKSTVTLSNDGSNIFDQAPEYFCKAKRICCRGDGTELWSVQ